MWILLHRAALLNGKRMAFFETMQISLSLAQPDHIRFAHEAWNACRRQCWLRGVASQPYFADDWG